MRSVIFPFYLGSTRVTNQQWFLSFMAWILRSLHKHEEPIFHKLPERGDPCLCHLKQKHPLTITPRPCLGGVKCTFGSLPHFLLRLLTIDNLSLLLLLVFLLCLLLSLPLRNGGRSQGILLALRQQEVLLFLMLLCPQCLVYYNLQCPPEGYCH